MFDGPRKYAIAKESTVDVDIDYPILDRLSDGRLVVISGRYFTQEGKAFGHRRLYISENDGNSWEWIPITPERPGVKYPVWDIPLPLTHEFEDGEGFCVLGTFPTRSPSDISHIPIILNRFKNGSVEREEGNIHIPDRMDDSDGITDICTVYWDQVLQLSDGSLICPMDARLKGDDAMIDRENFEIAGSIAVGMDRWAFCRVIIIRSEDRGRTWNTWGNVGSIHQDEGLNESSLRLTPAGDLVIVMRMGHQSPLHIAWSSDRGQTWTDPVPTPFPTGTLPKLTVLEDGSLVLLHGVQSIIPPEVTEQVNDVRPSLNLKFKYRMGEVNLGVSRDGTGKKWDEIGNVLTWPNTTGNGGILTTGPNSVGLVFDLRGYRTRQGKFAFCVVKYVEVDLGKTMWP